MRVKFSDLHHQSPNWADAPVYFITICTHERGRDQLCGPSAPEILRSVSFYHESQRWFCHLAVLMPDHVHFLLSFGDVAGYAKVIGDWKRWVSRHQGIEWQENFFEHRLRKEESLEQKGAYLLNNPVRAGLETEAKDWAYFWPPVLG